MLEAPAPESLGVTGGMVIGSVTDSVTLASAAGLLLNVRIISHSPAPTAVTLPMLSTSATEGSVERHISSDSVLPAGYAIGIIISVSPVSSSIYSLSRTTFVSLVTGWVVVVSAVVSGSAAAVSVTSAVPSSAEGLTEPSSIALEDESFERPEPPSSSSLFIRKNSIMPKMTSISTSAMRSIILGAAEVFSSAG